MTQQTNNNNEQDEYLVPAYSAGHFMKWLAVSITLIGGLVYMAYSFGSNANQRKVNRLSQQIQHLDEMSSLENLVAQFQSISRTIKLSSNERTRLTELLDQLVLHKSSLEQSEVDLKTAKSQLAQLKQEYQSNIQRLQAENQQLTDQVAKLESAMSYAQGSVKTFTVGVFESFQILDDTASRIGLEKILNTGSAQIYVGNALMFFHVGHTLRFRFSPNWLCDVTLIKIDEASEKVEFEYVCEINQ